MGSIKAPLKGWVGERPSEAKNKQMIKLFLTELFIRKRNVLIFVAD